MCQRVSNQCVCDVRLSPFMYLCINTPLSLTIFIYFVCHFDWHYLSFQKSQFLWVHASLSIDISLCSITVNDQREYDAI